MFWNKKKKEIKVSHIPLPILIRQAIYDSMLEPAEAIAEAMGLPPISNEVAEMEEQASQERLSRISALLPFIESHSDMAARITASAYALDDDDFDSFDEWDEKFNTKDYEKLVNLFKLVALSSSLSCISTLFNLNLLTSKAVKEDVY